MKPKFIALNLLLVAGIAGAIWQMRLKWTEAEVLRNKNLNVKTRPVAPPAIPAAPKPDPAPAAKYAEVAKNNLFSKDRNPDIVIEPPKVEAPKPMPPLPVVYGVMGLPSGMKAIMAEKSGVASKAVRAGDTIGEFKVLALDSQKVDFEWNGKQIEKKVEDLVDRSAPVTSSGQPAAPAAPAPAAPPPPTQVQQTLNTNPSFGVDLTATTKACKPGDASPPGTVSDGFRKVATPSPFGTVCRWVKQ